MAIGSCDCCDRQNVPVAHLTRFGMDVTACYICQGEDDPDPYGETEGAEVKTTKQMFGVAVRDIATTERAMREDATDAKRREAEAEARLDAPITRREVLDALETVLGRYSVYHYSMTRELLQRLAEALK